MFAKTPKAAALVVTVELAVMFAGSTLLTPLYDVYRRAFGFSELTLTLVYSVYVVGNVLALVLFGRLSDQIGRRWTTFTAMLLAGGSSAIYLAASTSAWLFAGRALSGLAIGVASGTAAAWIADLGGPGSKARASILTAMGNFAGIAAGPLLAGVLAQYAPAPLWLSHCAYLAILLGTAVVVATVPETVQHPIRDVRAVSLKPRVGLPAGVRIRFVPPAAAMFAALSLVGFYAALLPGFMKRELHQTNLAEGGAVVATMFLAGAVGVWLTRSLENRRATLSALGSLVVSLALLVLAQERHSMPVLFAGTVIGGVAAAVAYRGGLHVVNQITPEDRRAEVISSYMLMGFLGNALSVIGVGVLSKLASPRAADVGFAAAVGAVSLAALMTGAKLVPRSEPRPA